MFAAPTLPPNRVSKGTPGVIEVSVIPAPAPVTFTKAVPPLIAARKAAAIPLTVEVPVAE